MSPTFPSCCAIDFALDFQFITRNKSYIIFFDWEYKVSDSFLWQTPIPSYLYVLLRLAFFKRLVIVSLQFYKRLKNLLVLVWVPIPQKYRLVQLFILVHHKFGEVGRWLFLPHLFDSCNLIRFYLARLTVFKWSWFFYQPSFKPLFLTVD